MSTKTTSVLKVEAIESAFASDGDCCACCAYPFDRHDPVKIGADTGNVYCSQHCATQLAALRNPVLA
jgi:hypothetical protein